VATGPPPDRVPTPAVTVVERVVAVAASLPPVSRTPDHAAVAKAGGVVKTDAVGPTKHGPATMRAEIAAVKTVAIVGQERKAAGDATTKIRLGGVMAGSRNRLLMPRHRQGRVLAATDVAAVTAGSAEMNSAPLGWRQNQIQRTAQQRVLRIPRRARNCMRRPGRCLSRPAMTLPPEAIHRMRQ